MALLVLDPGLPSSLVYGSLFVELWKYADLYLTALSPTHQLPSSSALFPLHKHMTQDDGAATVQPTLTAHQDHQGQARERPGPSRAQQKKVN